MVFQASGIPVRIRGLENLPAGPSVVVANHASYADGALMQAVLPARFGFVVKKEMDRIPLAGLLLRRLGTVFVDRFNAREGASDTAKLVRNRDAIAVFPEGTFHPDRGLRRFRMGAFYAAVRGNMPVVPVSIRGTRRLLPAGRWLPRPVPLEVRIAAPVHPAGRGREAAYVLAGTVREIIIANCGERSTEDDNH
jgi:1-acyl-sn-glycerol-3-phosphate acyltransferase